MGAASRKESPTPSQTLLASLALMRRSLRLGSLASPLPSSFPARSLAGPARGVRRALAPARSQSVFHANPRAASFPSAVTAPLPLGLPASSPAPRRLLLRAPCSPPPHPQPPGLEVLGAGAQILRWGSELSRQPSPSLRSCSLLPPFLPVAPTSTHIRVHAFLPLTHISGPVRESLGRGELEGGRVL